MTMTNVPVPPPLPSSPPSVPSSPPPRRTFRTSRLIAGFVILTAVVAVVLLLAAHLTQRQEAPAADVLAAPTPDIEALGIPGADQGDALSAALPPGAKLPPGASPPGGLSVGDLPAGFPPQGALPDGMPRAPAAAPPRAIPTPRPPPPTPTPAFTASLNCSEGVYFDVRPRNALVTINNQPLGEASQWSRSRNAFELDRDGVYFVGLSLPGFHPEWFRVTVDPAAADKVVKLSARLVEVGREPGPAPTPEPLVCSEGIYFDVRPSHALVTINGEPVGEVGQWSRSRNAFQLASEGMYVVGLSCPGCRSETFTVTVDKEAKEKVAKISARLQD